MSSPTGQMKSSFDHNMMAPTAAPDISEACVRANEEDSYNGAYTEKMRAERMRAADAYDNYTRAANHARERMEACDAALAAIVDSDQPKGLSMRG